MFSEACYLKRSELSEASFLKSGSEFSEASFLKRGSEFSEASFLKRGSEFSEECFQSWSVGMFLKVVQSASDGCASENLFSPSEPKLVESCVFSECSLSVRVNLSSSECLCVSCFNLEKFGVWQILLSVNY